MFSGDFIIHYWVMEKSGAVVLKKSPATTGGRVLKGSLILGLISLTVWSSMSGHEVVSWFLLILLAILFSLELRRHTHRVDSEGVRVVTRYLGKGLQYRWQEISKVEVECRGEDKSDMDFCHHITLFTNKGKRVRASDHGAHNFLEFVTALQGYLGAEDQRKKLDVVIKRYAEK